jgi:RHS repeat-associated protein
LIRRGAGFGNSHRRRPGGGGGAGGARGRPVYDPWGLELAGIGYNASGNPEHKFTYNGKEKQSELGLNWIDYGWRNYDAQLGRWHAVDGMSEKYLSYSPYHYAANNPIKNYDIDGNQFTPAAQAWVDRLTDEIDRKERNNNDRIANKQAKLNQDGISQKKADRLNRQINRLQANNQELNTVRQEVNVMAQSAQVYNVVESNTFNDQDRQKAAATYNTVTGAVDIVLPTNSGLNLFAHELKHGFQFETGTISLTAHNGDLGMLPARNWLAYDQQDELEAYRRQGVFGSTERTLPDAYRNRPVGPTNVLDIQGIVALNNLPAPQNHAQLQNFANRMGMAFRINNQTYGPRPNN